MCTCNKSDTQKQAEFATMVCEVERAAAVLARPWQVATGVLTLALTAALLWRKRK